MNRTMMTLLMGAILGAFTNGIAHAANIGFSTDIISSCGIVVTRDGTLVARNNVRVLNSTGAGGQNGLATVTTNGNIFQLHVDQPTQFDIKPAADTTPERDFRARISSTGATSFAWTRNSQNLNAGTNNVRIQFRARKAGGVTFANGFYSATVVIRCE